ncbi:MAG: hypothetical protein M1822_008915 [Bathelium mastoideum]|nr:MAG: hypothetical protein M1822_008915 [Bathelium mastoideum]
MNWGGPQTKRSLDKQYIITKPSSSFYSSFPHKPSSLSSPPTKSSLKTPSSSTKKSVSWGAPQYHIFNVVEEEDEEDEDEEDEDEEPVSLRRLKSKWSLPQPHMS